jgi:uncharacterized phage-associated protein
MAGLVSQFDRRKAIEAILYLANRLRRPDVHSICKVLYQADRHNLERYGQSIAGDFYCAMEFGPVPSGVYDLINEQGASGDLGFRRDGNAVVPSRDADTDWLSEADVESLDRAIETHGSLTFDEHVEATHGAAWLEAWNRRGKQRSVRMHLRYITEGMRYSEELLQYLTG